MQPIDVNVDLDDALNVDISLAAPISVPITLAPDVIISVDVDAVGPAGPSGVGIPSGGTTGQYLKKSSGVDYATEWSTISGTGTVTSVNGTGANGVSVSGGPITTSGSLTIGLGAITPTSVSASGAVTGSNLSGTNTGDQTTITGNSGTSTALQNSRTIGILTGDVTSAGSSFNGTANNTNTTVLATVNSNVGSFTYGSFTVNAKGLITAASNGTTPEVPLTFSTGLTRTTNTVTVNTSQNIATLSNLTSNGFVKTSGGTGALSVDTSTYLTANQTITISGDITGSGTTAITSTYNNVVPSTKGGAGTVSGLLKANGSGVVSSATAGTDYQAPITLTTTGTSGAATLIANVLNIPQYSGGGGGSGITRSITVTSGNVSAGATSAVDYVYIIAGAHTVTLPTAVGNTNRYTLKNSHTAPVAIAFTGAETADGGAVTLQPGASIDLISNNTNWSII